MSNGEPELPNILMFVEKLLHGTSWASYLKLWECMIFALFITLVISVLAFLAVRKKEIIPKGLQNAAECFVEMIDGFLSEVLGTKGRKYTPFIGTLFIYILFMNLSGLIPFMKPATSDWSITLALALIVFVYVEYTSIKELGFFGYIDHLMGNPRGFLAVSVIFPVMMFCLHFISEIIRPLTLSLRLRSNIWGDHLLLALLSGFGLTGLPLLIFSTFLSLIASIVQAVVFCLLTTIYFALVLTHEEEHLEQNTN